MEIVEIYIDDIHYKTIKQHFEHIAIFSRDKDNTIWNSTWINVSQTNLKLPRRESNTIISHSSGQRIGSECEASFQTLKQKLCENPILVHFNPNFTRCVSTLEFTQTHLVTLQEWSYHQSMKMTKNKYWYMHYVFSRMPRIQHNLWEGVIGHPVCFKKVSFLRSRYEIFTNHIALESTIKVKDIHGRLLRMKMHLSTYDCVVLFRKGKSQTNIDALSRLIEVKHVPLSIAQFEITKNS